MKKFNQELFEEQAVEHLNHIREQQFREDDLFWSKLIRVIIIISPLILFGIIGLLIYVMYFL